jgi:hypothetical protein
MLDHVIVGAQAIGRPGYFSFKEAAASHLRYTNF